MIETEEQALIEQCIAHPAIEGFDICTPPRKTKTGVLSPALMVRPGRIGRYLIVRGARPSATYRLPKGTT